MDTSETYVKMCEKAVEIQEKWTQQLGDFYAGPAREKTFIYIGLMDSDFLWLPRQDQLQEMVRTEEAGEKQYIRCLLDDFNVFCNPLNRLGVMPHNRQIIEVQKEEELIEDFDSMEQLWLAFVMDEKYGKIWDGENWVLIPDKKKEGG